MGGRVRLAALLGVCLLAIPVVAACSGRSDHDTGAPLAMMKSGDELIVFIGKQCDDAGYPTRVTVANYDRGARRVAEPPLWEVETDKPVLLPSVSLGQLPNGFTEVTNHLGGQGAVGPALRVEVVMAESVVALFDTGRLVDGRVLESTGELVSLESFRTTYGCA